MNIDWDALQAEMVANTAEPYVGLLPLLSEQLGVSVESLRALGCGYRPGVQFKKRSGGPWWTFPERDAAGKIVGISLRAAEGGTKIMYPGSKHGLIYAPDLTPKETYAPGKHNWVRTQEAKVLCPICDKPDGCLVSAENPADPKAVLCIRDRSGVPMGDSSLLSFLHIRRPAGDVSSRPNAATNGDDPVLIVEGATDTCSGLDLAFTTIGRPSNLAGLGLLRDLLGRRRRVVVIGENDIKADGRHPGRDGVEAVFHTLRSTCEVVKVFPPQEYKDLREWKAGAKLTKESLLEYITKHGITTSDSRTLETREPLRIAERWLREEHWSDGIPILRRFAGKWFRFDGTRYAEADEGADIRGRLYSWLTERMVVKENVKGEAKLEPYDADKSKITNLIDALWRDCPIAVDPPCWIDGRTKPDPGNLICFPNGLFDVGNYLYDGSVVLHPLDPTYFTFSTLPYAYDPDAQCPQWLKFLSQIFPREPAKSQLLQEWFGYNLVPDVSHQKFMLMLGKAGSGKSTTLHVLASMLGPHHVAWTSLDQLSERFGITQLIGKSAALVPDGHIGRFTDTSILIERLKVLTGENGGKMAVRKMREDANEARFFARVTIAANEPPSLPDDANALRRRTLALLFTEEFIRNPDRGLPDRLAAEAPGVFNWALEGLVRLRQRGEFTMPESSVQLADDLSRIASPLREFVHRCCEVSTDHTILADTFIDAWRNWMRTQGGGGGMSMKIIYALCSTYVGIKQVLDVKNGQKYLHLHGITLTQDAKEKYLK